MPRALCLYLVPRALCLVPCASCLVPRALCLVNIMKLDPKSKYSIKSSFVIILIIAAIVAANFIFSKYFVRFDLTEDKQYVISDVSKELVKNLQEPVAIKVYFSTKLPPQLLAVTQQVKDILDEYRLNSGGKVSIDYLDPADNPETEQEAISKGVQEVQFNFFEKDKVQVQKGYLGIVFSSGDKSETIPVVQDVASIEYDITSALKKLLADEIKTVGFLTGHQEHGFATFFVEQQEGKRDDYVTLNQVLRQTYQVTTVDISAGQPITDVDTLIVAGPQEALSQRELFEIDQFIMNGGKVVFLVDRVNILGSLLAIPLSTGLEDLLANYGVTVKDNLVLDQINEVAAFTAGGLQYMLEYPYFVKLIRDNFDLENPIVAKLESIVLTWASSLEPVEQEGIETTVLVKTSDRANTTTGPYQLAPDQIPQIAESGRQNMVILAAGQFQSYFKDKKIPPVEKSDEVGETQTLRALPDDKDREIKTVADEYNQIIVVGDSDFLGDDAIKRWPANLAFFLNAVDYLTLDPDLITIRSKTITERPIKDLSSSLKLTVKVFGIFLPSVLFVLYGILRIWLRKKTAKIG